MTPFARQWFMWAFDTAMAAAVRQHGDAARLAAYTARIEFDRLLPSQLTASVALGDDAPPNPDPADNHSHRDNNASGKGIE